MNEAARLQKKIDWEQKKYMSYLMLCSTADVLGRTEEIYVKQMIYKQLSCDIRSGDIESVLCTELMKVDDLIDRIYLKSKETVKENCIDRRAWTYMLNAVRFQPCGRENI